MGNITGRAMSLSGDIIAVTFSSGQIGSTKELTISNIEIQADGGGEYTPLKLTTASISVLTDGTDGIELLRLLSRANTQVNIVNETKNSTLFVGYVVPNATNQRFLGVNDTATIECVDQLGYTQYFNYTQVDAGRGFSVLTIADVVSNIADLVGINTILVPSGIKLRNPVDRSSTSSFENLTVSENSFFTKLLPDPSVLNDNTDGFSYMPYANTCKAVLEMISESFRLTWQQVGNALYLHIGTLFGSYRYLGSSQIAIAKVATTISEDSFQSGDCTVSQLLRYSRVKVSHKSVDQINLLPDPFNQDFLTDIGQEYKTYKDDDDADDNAIVRAVRLQSEIFHLPNFAPGAPIESTFVAWKKLQGWRTVQDTLVTDQNDVFKNGTWSTAIRLYDNGTDTARRELVSIYLPYMQATVASGNTYIYPDIEFSIGKANDARLYPYNDEKKICYLWASLEIDGMYYDIKTNSYTSSLKRFLMRFSSNGDCTLDLDNASVGYTRRGIPILREGPICFTIYSRATQELGWVNGWIKKLQLNLRRGYSAEAIIPPTEYYGEFTEPGRDLEISPPIDMYYTLSENRFGTVINGKDYRGNGEIELLYNHNGEDITLPHFTLLQANAGDGLTYTINLHDKDNSIMLGDRFNAPLWEGSKIVVSLQKDLINNSTTVTLV